MSTEITVAIVEDNRQTREELAILIGGSPGYRVGGKFASMEEALAMLRSGDFDPRTEAVVFASTE